MNAASLGDVVHRDATISLKTRDDLEAAAAVLRDPQNHPSWRRRELAASLDQVVGKWDGNEATEILVTPDGDQPLRSVS